MIVLDVFSLRVLFYLFDLGNSFHGGNENTLQHDGKKSQQDREQQFLTSFENQKTDFSCGVCLFRGIPDHDALRQHLIGHCVDFKFFCYECGKGFKTYSGHNNHLKIIHSYGGDRYICEMCSKVFPSASTLRMHFHTHSDVRAFVCNVCGKAYKRKHDLKKHPCAVPVTYNM